MRKLFLIKNSHLFQGEKYLKKNKNYFEGWYFKNTNNKEGISFIPGVSMNKKEKKAFIQVINNHTSYYINYDIRDFKFNVDPFYIRIGNNLFSKESIHIDIKDEIENISVYGDLEYSNSKNISVSKMSPNIMGPFSYVPFMECNHGIISMKCNANGVITINNKEIVFNNDIGYIEKDWGCSFPKYYIWCQGNNFENKSVSFMLSIADIPFKIFNFRGVISSLIIDNEEYRFATYNGTKIVKYEVTEESLNVELKKEHYHLSVKSEYLNGSKLIAPVKGEMKKDIIESINAVISITLKKEDKIVFAGVSSNCGLEIVSKDTFSTH